MNEFSKASTLYERVYCLGVHVVGTPPIPEWSVYSAPAFCIYGTFQFRAHKLFWINHETKECVEYYRFEELIDPRTFPYDMKS